MIPQCHPKQFSFEFCNLFFVTVGTWKPIQNKKTKDRENIIDSNYFYVKIKLFFGPKAMTSTTWGPVLEKLAQQGLILFFCIDDINLFNFCGGVGCGWVRKPVICYFHGSFVVT